MTATLALVVALGGTTYAATQIDGSSLKNRSVAGKKLKKNSVGAKEVNEARLGAVPLAQRAAAADTATSAAQATNAATLQGKGPDAFLAAGGTAAEASHAASADSAASAGNAALLDNLDSAEFLRAGGKAVDAVHADTADNATLLGGFGSGDFAKLVHNHDGTYVNEGQPGSVSADMILDTARAVQLSLASFTGCDTSTGTFLPFTDGTDAVPHYATTAGGGGRRIRFDAVSGSPDSGYELCSELRVPPDYASGGHLEVWASKGFGHTGNPEHIACSANVNGTGVGATTGTPTTTNGFHLYSCTPIYSQPLSVFSHLGLAVSIAAPDGAMDNTVDIHSITFIYNAKQ